MTIIFLKWLNRSAIEFQEKICQKLKGLRQYQCQLQKFKRKQENV